MIRARSPTAVLSYASALLMLGAVVPAVASGPAPTVVPVDVRPWTSNAIPVHSEVLFQLNDLGTSTAVIVEFQYETNDWDVLDVLLGPEIGPSGTVYSARACLGDETFETTSAVLLRARALTGAEHEHPRTGRVPEVLTDVAYDVDYGQSLDIEYVGMMISNAAAYAISNAFAEPYPDSVLQGGSPPGFVVLTPAADKFHYWPNVLDLTRIGEEDPGLLDLVLDEIHALVPDPVTARSILDADLAAGDRIFLARDFITLLDVGPLQYEEVHYAYIINLDDEEVYELQVHGRESDGLGFVHDPHTDTLQDIFDGHILPQPIGEVWHMCLRGNFTVGKYQAVIVDRLETPSPETFYVRRIHQFCHVYDPTNPPPPFVPVIVTNPPPIKPPPPKMDPPITKVPPEDLEAGEAPPFRPWPFRDKREPEDAGSSPGEEAGRGAANQPGWSVEEQQKLQQLVMQAAQEVDAMRAANDEDLGSFRNQSYTWVEGQTYNNPCLSNLYAQFQMQIDVVNDCLASNAAEAAVLQAASEADVAALSAELRVLRSRENWWCEIFTVGGPWMNIKTTCVNAVATFMWSEIAIIDETNWTPFEQALRKCLKMGGTWVECEKVALDNSRKATGYKFYDDQLWKNYLDCLRDLLYPAKIRSWLEFRGWSASDIDRMIPIMIHGEGALTPSLATEWATFQTNETQRILQGDTLAASTAAKVEEIKDINRDFRSEALEHCFPMIKMRALDAENCKSILDTAQQECQSGTLAQTLPWIGDSEEDLCRAFQKLLDLINQIRIDTGDPNACQALEQFIHDFLAGTGC